MIATIVLALTVVACWTAAALRPRGETPGCRVEPSAVMRGTADAYIRAVEKRMRRRSAAEHRARRLGMTDEQVRRAGNIAAGPQDGGR